ncbi:Hypothetical predicted protein [Olea europaea subsp. europaea]|uniref:Uncharacterized protein n=1 Tax=Olea europaea subsp. europaea TaxID=158383 RepID=A0A8S0QVW5_OLEEU|nr:Hypothetical predicted protein [Olea europaea subsp. europaea]
MPRADRYELDLALIIEGVFNALDSHAGIEIPTLSIVDHHDTFFFYPWVRVSYRRLIRGFRVSLGRKFVDAKNKKEKAVTYIVHGFPISMQLHVYATLHPIEAECGQPYIFILVSFEDCNVPALDDVARDSITPQFHAEPLGSWGNVENSTGVIEEEESSRGGSDDDEESGSSEGEGDSEESGGYDTRDGNCKDSEEGEDDSGDSNGASAGASLTRVEVEEMLLDQRTLIEIHLRTMKFEIMQHATYEGVNLYPRPPIRHYHYCTYEGGGDRAQTFRYFIALVGGGGLHSEPGLNGDDDEAASDGLENGEDKPAEFADGGATDMLGEAGIPCWAMTH